MNPAEPQHAEVAEHHPIGVAPGAARRHLVTPNQEVADPVVDVIVDRPIGHEPRAVAEVRGPAAKQAVQAIAHLRPRSHVARNQEVADLGREPEHALLRRARPELPVAVLAIAVRTERIAKEVEANAGRPSPWGKASSEASGYAGVFQASSPITDPRLRPKRTRSKGPFLRRHYPASPVVWPSPTPVRAAA